MYMKYLYPTYWGSPIVNDSLQDYRFRKIDREAVNDPDSMFVVEGDGKLYCAAKLSRINHLSDHFKIEVASIENEAFVSVPSPMAYHAAFELFRAVRKKAQDRKFLFVSASVASMAFQWQRALEDNGFRFADGFLHMVSSSNDNYDNFLLNDLVVRDPISSDFDEIAFSYEQVPFPSHWLYEPEFDKPRMAQLFVKRYREVYENKDGRLLVGELNGQFASALICMIDRDIQRETGIIVNPASMGIIVHPRAARKGVSISLVAFRHNLYREMGLKYGYFGANINNYQMIRGLEKMGMRFSGVNISMMLRL
jgi:RimJ/RimL family protein N-acetyltransferase